MSSLLSGERPLNGNSMAIHTTAPGLSLSPQRNSISDPAFAQALSREQTDCDLGLVQPAAVARRVVQRKSTSQPTSPFFAEPLHYRFAGMRTQIVQHQVNGVGFGIASGDIQQVVCEVGRGAMSRDFGEVSSGFRPQRRYSPSRRATCPGRMARGGRTSWCSTTGFSSIQTTGSRSLSGFSYTARMSSIRRI